MDFQKAENSERANRLFSKPCTFVRGVASFEQLPPADRVEIAFAGRSNVGKSSLINALFNSKSIAKTSSTPGRTQQLNYFDFLGQMYLVDLPGYGFAKAPPQEVKRWQQVLLFYLKGRANLRRVFLLVDSRIGLKGVDEAILKTLDEAAVSYQIVLTKIDKISNAELEKVKKDVAAELSKHAAAHTKILATSADKKIGLEELKAEIVSFIED